MQDFDEFFDEDIANGLKKAFKAVDIHEAVAYYLKDVEVFGIDEKGTEALIGDSTEFSDDKWTCFAIEYDTGRMTVRNLIKELMKYDGDLEIVFNHGDKILHFDDLGVDDDILDFFIVDGDNTDFFITEEK